jgi:hypothetical protein
MRVIVGRFGLLAGCHAIDRRSLFLGLLGRGRNVSRGLVLSSLAQPCPHVYPVSESHPDMPLAGCGGSALAPCGLPLFSSLAIGAALFFHRGSGVKLIAIPLGWGYFPMGSA